MIWQPRVALPDQRPGDRIRAVTGAPLRVMSGRDPDERHRAATPLELLYDLTFVVAFGVASEQFAHLLAEGHFAAGLTAFGLAIFAICWAWINFSWFASAYDTDDWAFRCHDGADGRRDHPVAGTSTGVPLDRRRPPRRQRRHGRRLRVMRVTMLFLWLRAAGRIRRGAGPARPMPSPSVSHRSAGSYC